MDQQTTNSLPITGSSAAKPVTESPENLESISRELTEQFSPTVQFLTESFNRLTEQLFTHHGLYQMAILITGFFLAWLFKRFFLRLIDHIWPSDDTGQYFMASLHRSLCRSAFQLGWVISLWAAIPLFDHWSVGNDILRIAASVLQAWVLINLFSSVVKDHFWSRLFAICTWLVAVLYTLRLLDPAISLLDSLAITVGKSQVSAFDILKGIMFLIFLIWLANQVSEYTKSRIYKAKNLTPSVKTLYAQVVKLVALFVAVIIALNAVGIDLTALAVFFGAIGVGIGFGLQTIFSNLISGVIILLEGSIKVGDFVELDSGITGEVKDINTRATVITTNDNVDILVPNSQFINGVVTNWTLREKFRRTCIPFGVAYGTDKELVKKAALQAAANVPHELTGDNAKPAQVWLVGFGESSLDFELVVWLQPEAVKKPRAVMAEYYWELETALGEHNIEIPFPQRDLHLRSSKLPINLTASDTP